MNTTLRHILFVLIFRPWLRQIIGIKSINADIVNRQEQFIIVANHNSHFDTATLMSNLNQDVFDKTHPIAEIDYFNQTKLLQFVSSKLLNVKYITKTRLEKKLSTLDILDDLLKKGKSIILFPEGTRGKPGELSEFKSGVAVLLKKNAKIPFIPVFLSGMGNILPKGSRLILPYNAIAFYGQPKRINSKKNNDELLKEIKESIFALDPSFTNP